jgi:hypothetical protein
MTMTELFAEAGGLKPFSKLSEVIVIRNEGESGERTYFVDVDAIFDGTARDARLHAGDRIRIDEDWK